MITNRPSLANTTEVPGDIEVILEQPALPGLDAGMEVEVGPEHSDNLAAFMDEDDLLSVGAELVEFYDADKRSRKEWENSYTKGLKLLGLSIEERTDPWPGASGVFHPLLTEAIVRFQSNTIMELFPAKGPVKTEIIGKKTPEVLAQAKRVQADMNYQIVDVMTEFRPEQEQLLFTLALSGSAFKKVYMDPMRGRATSMFVAADDVVVPYGAADLKTCGRYCHRVRMSTNDIMKMMVSGAYVEEELPEPTPEMDGVQEEEDKLQGRSPTIEHDDRHLILEYYVDYNLPGFEDPDGIALPYIITVHKQTNKVLSIYRNWKQDDPLRKPDKALIHYRYIPGPGFYGIGLIHLIGGLAKSATSIIRQLIDAGTLANLPAGFKTRGLRIKGDNSPLTPGEFRDVDVPSGAIRDNFLPLPFKEPSSVLYSLLGNVVEEGRNLGSVPDMKIADMNQEAPVGTTLAIIERGMKVMSAVQARIHYAMRDELKLLADIIYEFYPDQYDIDFGEPASRKEDYGGKVDVLPVSNPNASTMAQRIMQGQAALQLSAMAPEIYDRKKLHRQMLEIIGIEDAKDIVPLDEDMKPTDPVSENMNILTSKPVKAFLHQDHEAHIATHMAAAEDPKLAQMVAMSPNAKMIQGALAAHITEHIAFQYRKEIEQQMGVPLPPEDEPLPPDIEVELSRVVAQAAAKLLKKDQAEAQAQKNQQMQQDPVIQMQQKELQLKEADLQRKVEEGKQRAQAAGLKASIDMMTKMQDIRAKKETEGAKLGVEIAKALIKAQSEGEAMTVEAFLRIVEKATDMEAMGGDRKEGESDENDD